jgi:hypothetical protein
MAKASTHFRLIQLAYNHKLTGEAERFRLDVYPIELNERLEAEIQRLKRRKAALKQLYGARSDEHRDVDDAR